MALAAIYLIGRRKIELGWEIGCDKYSVRREMRKEKSPAAAAVRLMDLTQLPVACAKGCILFVCAHFDLGSARQEEAAKCGI